MKKIRALFFCSFIGISALSFAQDFFFENELSFRLDRKCAEKSLLAAELFKETESKLIESGDLSSISGESYQMFTNTLQADGFVFEKLSLSQEVFNNHIIYYQLFNTIWTEMWNEDSAFAIKSHFYKLKTSIDSFNASIPIVGVANTFTAFSRLSDELFFVPFYRNLIINWAVVAYFEPETGLPVALPEIPVYDLSGIQQNVLFIRITNEDEIFIAEGKSEMKSTLVDVRNSVMKHITNEGKNPMLALSSEQAIVSLKNERGTSYTAYVNVYNEIVGAYNFIRDEYSQNIYKIPYSQLSKEQQKVVNEKYPQKIAEAEPISTDK